MLKKKTVNILYDNTIYRPRVDDDTNELINDLQSEILILNSKLLESYEELDANKETIKKLKKLGSKEPESKKQEPKKKYSIPMYPICYMYIPVYQINHVCPSYPIYPIYSIIYYPLCH